VHYSFWVAICQVKIQDSNKKGHNTCHWPYNEYLLCCLTIGVPLFFGESVLQQPHDSCRDFPITYPSVLVPEIEVPSPEGFKHNTPICFDLCD
jgi:hypothetical protein